jgi:hypothetical protein
MTLYHIVDTDFQASMTRLTVVCILTLILPHHEADVSGGTCYLCVNSEGVTRIVFLLKFSTYTASRDGQKCYVE